MTIWEDLGEIVSLIGVDSDSFDNFSVKYSTDNITWFWF